MTQITKENLFKGLLLISPLVIFWLFNHQNMPLKFSMLLGLIVAPYVLSVGKKSVNYRYVWLALGAGITLLFIRSNTLYFYAALFILLFVIDNWFGKSNNLLLLLGIVISPAINTIVYIWSFPMRLKLSKWAGDTLRLIGMNIEVEGNVLWLDGHSFSVDPACIGLKMVITALVLGIVILAYFEKKKGRIFSFWQVSSFLMLIVLASVMGNFIRLLTLIIFHILPENPLHDVIGLLSMGVYVLFPFYWLVYFFEKRKEKETVNQIRSNFPFFENKKYTIHFVFTILILLHIYNGIQFLGELIENKSTVENIKLKGLEDMITPQGVLKMEDDSTLIYIKPPVRFFQGSHDPRFCWQGSGYEFSEVELEKIGQKLVYTATLTKGEDQFYTSWWYESQAFQTPHEWDWRWKNLQNNESFYMVNVSHIDKKGLEDWVKMCSVLFSGE